MITAEQLILDTGALWEYFVRSYQSVHRTSWLLAKCHFCVLTDETLFDGFREMLGRKRGWLLTVPGVIAELQGHARRAEHGAPDRRQTPFQKTFWELVQQEMRQLKFNEDICRVVDMDPTCLGAFGPVDTSLLNVAKSRIGGHHSCIMLVSDGDLFGRCRADQIPVEWVSDRIERFINDEM